MAQRRCAKKEIRKNKKQNERNLILKHQLKTAIKKLKKALEAGEQKTKEETLKNVYKLLAKAVSRKIIHSNKAARKKSRLTKLANKTKSAV